MRSLILKVSRQLLPAKNVEEREDIPYEDDSHVYIFNSKYKNGNAAPTILEYLRCIRKNDVTSAYESELMRAVCSAIKAVRSDEGKEASYMTLQILADERWAAQQEGIQKGIQKGIQEMILNLMDTAKLSSQQAMDALKIPDDERETYRALVEAEASTKQDS